VTRAAAVAVAIAAALSLGACRLPRPAGKVPEVGARAPDFELGGADGRTHRLADLLSAGPVVLVFYRGYW
jgi:hypothetical protein